MPDRSLVPQLFCEKDLDDSELYPISNGLAAIFTKKCPEKDTPNEDSSAIIPFNGKSGVLIVADGAGGQASGAKASKLAVTSLKRTIKKAVKSGDPLRVAILDGIELANKRISKLGIGAATTIAVVEINDKKIRPYHVGDSQILLIGQRGKLKIFTKAHSPVGYALEAGLISEKEALHHEERHIISNILGSTEMHIEVGPTTPIASNDTLIVASDGLFDNLKKDEIINTCRKGPLLQVNRHLAEKCNTRMTVERQTLPSKPDDLTFITFRKRVSD